MGYKETYHEILLRKEQPYAAEIEGMQVQILIGQKYLDDVRKKSGVQMAR